MKAFFKVLVVALLATAMGLAGDVRAATDRKIETGNFLFAQAPNVSADRVTVPVALPTLAEVFLKRGESISGRVTAIDLQGQTLLIEGGGRSSRIPLSQIERVAFSKSALVVRANGRPILRGENQVTAVGSQATWRGIPLNAFRLRDPSKGQADVGLGSVVSRPQLRGIRAVAENRQYVVNEIRFDPQRRTMTILATPH